MTDTLDNINNFFSLLSSYPKFIFQILVEGQKSYLLFKII